mgnify:CR=1 FL=1
MHRQAMYITAMIIAMMFAGENKIHIEHFQNTATLTVALGMLVTDVMKNGVIGTVFADGNIMTVGAIN